MHVLGILTGFALCAVIGLSASPAAASLDATLNCNAVSVFLPFTLNPLRVLLTNQSASSGDGWIEITEGPDNAVVIRQKVHVPPHSRVHMQMLMVPGRSGAQAASSPLVATAIWHASDGRELDRTSIGQILPHTVESPDAEPLDADRPRALLMQCENPNAPLYPAIEKQPNLASIVQTLRQGIVNPCSLDVRSLPENFAGYQPFQYIYLGCAPDDLDASQRQALLQHIAAGGVLVVCGADNPALAGSWLEPLLPVALTGSRLASEIVPRGQREPLKLPALLPIAEAVAVPEISDAQVVLQDAHYVHAAVRPYGLGRIAFVSFLPTALDPMDSRTRPIWRALLGLPRNPPMATSETDAAAQRRQEMAQMLGRPAPTWNLAAAVSAGYLLLVLVAHLFLGGVKRPLAFGAVTAAAVGICLVTVAAAALQHGGQAISGARLSAIILAPDGRGVARESDAFLGPSSEISLRAPEPAVAALPVDFNPDDAPIMTPHPFSSDDVGISPESIRQIWGASTAIDARPALRLRGTFGPTGLRLSADNALPATLAAPLLDCGPYAIRLADIPTGSSDLPVAAANRNPAGVFTHAEGVVSQTDRLRADIIATALGFSARSAYTLAPEPGPMALLGWLDSGAPALLQPGDDPPVNMRQQCLVKAIVQIDPSPVGSTVLVEGPFVRLERGRNGTIYPADAWGVANGVGAGEWSLLLVTPPEIGRVRPRHISVTLSADAPQHVVTLRDSTGVLATWTYPVGPQQIEADISPADLTPSGELQLTLSAEAPLSSRGSLPPRWTFRDLLVSVTGEVTAPPQPPALVPEPVERPLVTPPPTIAKPKAKPKPKPKPKPAPAG